MKPEGDGTQFTNFAGVDPLQLVDTLKKRWLHEARKDVDPSLVTLRLLPCAPDEDPSEADERAATELNPRRTLRDAGVLNGSSLVVHIRRAPEGASSTRFAALSAVSSWMLACAHAQLLYR